MRKDVKKQGIWHHSGKVSDSKLLVFSHLFAPFGILKKKRARLENIEILFACKHHAIKTEDFSCVFQKNGEKKI